MGPGSRRRLDEPHSHGQEGLGSHWFFGDFRSTGHSWSPTRPLLNNGTQIASHSFLPLFRKSYEEILGFFLKENYREIHIT